MIILEGPDLSGKSTVGIRIQALCGSPIHHYGGPPQGVLEFLQRVLNTSKHIIIDRHPCISEQVYGHIRGGKLMTDQFMDRILIEQQPTIIFCNPTLEYLLEQRQYLKQKEWKQSLHVDFIKENYVDIYDRYIAVMLKLSSFLDVYTIDFRSLDDSVLIQILIKEGLK
jgi:hypothetical protein